MSPSGQALWKALERAVRRVRIDAVLAVVLAALATVPAVLLVAWVWAGSGWTPRSVFPLGLVLGGLVGAAGIATILGRRWVSPVNDVAVAAAAERRESLPEGSLRGVLELGRGLQPGVSSVLFRQTETELAGRLAGSAPGELSGDLGDRARHRRTRLLVAVSAAAVSVAALGFVAPDRARGAWAPLLNPVGHATGPTLPPIRVRPGHAEVTRGARLDVAVTAPFRSSVTLHWRTMGAVPGARPLPVTDGGTQSSIGPVDAPTAYWVTAPDGAVTDTFTIRPLDPLMVSRLTVDVRYPDHVGREPDHFEGDVGVLRVPEGTRLRFRGTATRPLRSVALGRDDGRPMRAQLDGRSFSIDWRPDAEATGRWVWQLAGDGDAASVEPAPLDLVVVPDAPPEVRISVPGRDTLLGPSRRQLVVAHVADDYGIAAADLVFWRIDARGSDEPAGRVGIPVDGGDRALLRTVLDASSRPLVPGDAVHYRVEARDNSPAGQVGRSATYVLRLPGRAELRERARTETERLTEDAASLARQARDLEAATRDLGRQSTGQGRQGRPGGEPGRPTDSEAVGFEEASEAGQVLREHEDLLAGADELRQRMAELQAALDEAGLRDPGLQERLEELRELYGQLATPELRDELAALQRAVDELDPEAVKAALERLAEQQEALRERLDQSMELLRRAAAEQEMNALAREAEEVAAQQEALADAMREASESGQPSVASEGTEAERPDSATAGESAAPDGPRPPDLPSPDRAGQQDELEERTERLGESMRSLQQQLMQLGERDASSSAGSASEQSEGARQSMQEASSQAREQQGQQAAQSGEQAASQLSGAAQTLDEARERMVDAARQQAQQAMQQATQEALGLAEREESLRQQMEQAQQQGGAQGQSMQQMRSEQAALQQGLEQLGRNLSEAGQRAGMLNQDVGQSLARAMLDMQQTMDGMQDGAGPMPVQQAGRTVESLNQLAMSLLQNEAQMQGSQSGNSMQQALEQLSQLAREQGSLNGQLGAMNQMRLDQRAMTQQLQQAAMQQRSIARRVGSASDMLGGQENVLGRLDQLSSEAEAIARELDGGRLDPEVRARQERLFHRLLDAGRSLEREEYNDERVAERPGAVDPSTPAVVDPALLDARLRYPVPTAAELRGLPPAYRRLILEYFDRLNRAAAGSGSGGGG